MLFSAEPPPETAGNDASLEKEMFDVAGFERKILQHSARFVAFNGKKAAAVLLGLRTSAAISYGLHHHVIGKTRVVILPSTSGSASRYWIEQPWHDLATLVDGAVSSPAFAP